MAQGTQGSSGAFSVSSLQLKGGAGASIATFTGTINTATTWAGTYRARPGSLLINLTNLKLYINTGTKASPTWTIVGAQT
jgi:hypothetical protein